jgi:type I restriction enzyme S subunit
MVHESWQEIELGQVIDIKHGFAFKGKFFRDEPPGDVLLTPGNFAVGGGFKQDKLKYYEGPAPEEFVLTEGDLLITMTDLSRNADTLGYPAIVPTLEGGHFLHNQRLGKVIILDNERIDKRFLYYLLCTREYRHEIVAGATGTTVKHTSPTRIKAFRTKVPRLPVQQAIACILSALDDKIELNRRMNETLEGIARAVFKSWFVDFDPVRAKRRGEPMCSPSSGLAPHIADLFPDAFEASELGKIPKGWEAGTIKDCCTKIQNGGTPKRSEPSYWEPATIPWLTSGEVRQAVIVETENLLARTSSGLSWDSQG